MSLCTVVGLVLATANGTTTYYTHVEAWRLRRMDPVQVLGLLTAAKPADVHVVEGFPPIPKARSRSVRCGFESMYASLTGEPTP